MTPEMQDAVRWARVATDAGAGDVERAMAVTNLLALCARLDARLDGRDEHAAMMGALLAVRRPALRVVEVAP